MQAEGQMQIPVLKYGSKYLSTDEPNELINELLKVDFSHIKVGSAKIHPQWESLLESTQLKVTEELGKEFKLSKDFSDFSFYIFPSFGYELTSCILIYNMAAFLVDDYLDKFPNDDKRIVQQLRSRNITGNGCVEKWWQLSLKVCMEVMGEASMEQLFDHCVLWLTTATEVLSRSQCTLSDKDFVELRCVDSGASHQFFLVLISAGLQSSDELKNDPNYLGLNKQVARHVSLINDLYSLKKEVRVNIYKFNYVYVKMMNNNITAQAAVEEIILEIYEADRMARMYGENLKKKNDPKSSQYANAMYDVMAGNHYWSTICKRYNQPN